MYVNGNHCICPFFVFKQKNRVASGLLLSFGFNSRYEKLHPLKKFFERFLSIMDTAETTSTVSMMPQKLLDTSETITNCQ
jgi:hypothetical protein